MKTTYQYQFYPNTDRKQELNYWLGISRYWYDRQLGDLFDWWEMNGTAVNYCPPISSLGSVMESPNYYRQKQQLQIGKQESVKVVALKIVLFKIIRIVRSGETLDFTRVDSTVLPEVDRGIERAFERFFAGEIEGNRSGRYRWKTIADFRTKTFATATKDWIKLICKHWNYIRLPQPEIVKARVQESIVDGVKVQLIYVSKKVGGLYGKLCLENSTFPNSTPDRITPKWNNSLGLEAFLHQREEMVRGI